MKHDPLRPVEAIAKHYTGKQYTLDEVARELGVSRARAYQIQQKALKRFARGMAERGYTRESQAES